MRHLTIAVDLAKQVFEVAVSTEAGRITERKRRSRSQFERFWSLREPARVVMEACASAHFWGRRLCSLGHDVVLLPPHYVRPYVRRNKTARSALLVAEKRRTSGQRLTRLHAWVLERANEGHRNRAAVALANKMARVIWAVWRHERSFDGNYLPQAA